MPKNEFVVIFELLEKQKLSEIIWQCQKLSDNARKNYMALRAIVSYIKGLDGKSKVLF